MARKRIVLTVGINPTTIGDYLPIQSAERQRAKGDTRALCGALMRRGEIPSARDVGVAIEAGIRDAERRRRPLADCLAPELLALAARLLKDELPRKTGPKRGARRAAPSDMAVLTTYYKALDELVAAAEADASSPRVKTRALRETAEHYACSTKTIERILAKAPWRREPEKRHSDKV